MKHFILIIFFFFIVIENPMAQKIEDPITYIPWNKVVLRNYANFNTLKDLDWGSGFLIKYKNGVIACTAREFTGTILSPGNMLLIKDFDKELKYWKMYISDDPIKFVVMDSLIAKERIEKIFSVFYFSMPFLTFSLKQVNSSIIPLEPDIKKIKNKDTLYLVGYDFDHNLKIVQGIVENSLNEKYAGPEIRLKTNIFLNYENFVGGPIVDKNGNAVGVINRAYRLNINKRGNIIDANKIVEGSHFDYFVNGTSMRAILGKDYTK